MSRSQESMLSVNRSSVLLPWLDPNTLWLAWNSWLEGQQEQMRETEDIRKRNVPATPEAISSTFNTMLQAKPFINYRDRLVAAFQVINVKFRSLTAQTLCWKSFCLGWNRTKTSAGHSAIEWLIFTQNSSLYPNSSLIKQQVICDYLDIHACKVFLPLQYNRIIIKKWFFLAALQLITCTLTQKNSQAATPFSEDTVTIATPWDHPLMWMQLLVPEWKRGWELGARLMCISAAPAA